MERQRTPKKQLNKSHPITVVAVKLGAWWALRKELKRRKSRRKKIAWKNNA